MWGGLAGSPRRGDVALLKREGVKVQALRWEPNPHSWLCKSWRPGRGPRLSRVLSHHGQPSEGRPPRRLALSLSVQFEGGRSAEEIRKFWQNCEHPSINKQEWSGPEVEQLKAIAAKHGHLQWQKIAKELGVRAGGASERPGGPGGFGVSAGCVAHLTLGAIRFFLVPLWRVRPWGQQPLPPPTAESPGASSSLAPILSLSAHSPSPAPPGLSLASFQILLPCPRQARGFVLMGLKGNAPGFFQGLALVFSFPR